MPKATTPLAPSPVRACLARLPSPGPRALGLLLGAALAGCGGGGGGGGDATPPTASATVDTTPTVPAPASTPATTPAPAPTPTPTPTPTPAPTAALAIDGLELAQTHVLPEGGKSWNISSGSDEPAENLHFVGRRAALALVRLSATDAANPVLEGLSSTGASLGTVALAPPARLPATEGQGPAYGANLYSAIVPAAWMAPGLQLRARADNHAPGAARAPKIGADMPLTLYVLPFYLFGASDSTQPFAAVAAPDAATVKEIKAKWPVATLAAVNHPAQRANWPTLVVGPRADAGGTAQSAYVARSSSDLKDGFAPLSAVLSILGRIRAANGDAATPVQYYAPLVMIDGAGRYAAPGGGLGSVGGDTGAGDFAYRGIFIHEQGHAFGLNHAGEAFDDNRYPYEWGSLKGSAWGYDPDRNEFLPPFLPTTSTEYRNCRTATFAGHPRAVDGAGRCVKQDPMQSGSGDQDPAYRFATFSDFTSAAMQRHLEGTTTEASGMRTYGGGKAVRDSAFPGGYKRWDGIDLKWVNFTPVTTSSALYGVNNDFPDRVGVPVHTIVFSISNAGTVGATQIYPVLSYTGNLLRTVDPTSEADRAAIDPAGKGAWKWFCNRYGCDTTVRVTYANGTVRHVLVNNGFRDWFSPARAPGAAATDPKNGDSFANYAINVPADAAIRKIELLDTPMAWNGLPASPLVLASR